MKFSWWQLVIVCSLAGFLCYGFGYMRGKSDGETRVADVFVNAPWRTAHEGSSVIEKMWIKLMVERHAEPMWRDEAVRYFTTDFLGVASTP